MFVDCLMSSSVTWTIVTRVQVVRTRGLSPHTNYSINIGVMPSNSWQNQSMICVFNDTYFRIIGTMPSNVFQVFGAADSSCWFRAYFNFFVLSYARTLFTFLLKLIWVRHIAQCWQLGRKLSQKWRFISKFFSIWLIIGFLTLDLSHEQKHILDQFTKYSISRIFLWHWYLIYEALNMKISKSHYILAGMDSSKMKWCIQILFIAYLELLGQS